MRTVEEELYAYGDSVRLEKLNEEFSLNQSHFEIVLILKTFSSCACAGNTAQKLETAGNRHVLKK